MKPERHKERIRKRARGISWLLAPLLALAYIAWFSWNMVVCPSGKAEDWQLDVCRHAHLLPDLVGALVIANLVWLAFAIVGFSEEVSGKLGAADSGIKRYSMRAAHGYRALDDDHRDIVFRGLEAAGWSAAFTAGVLVFYHAELAPPLALLVIALLLRILYGLAKWLHDRRTGGGAPPAATAGGGSKRSPPTGGDASDKRVLSLADALSEEFQAIYKTAPKPLASGGAAKGCDSGFCVNMALNHMEQDSAALCFSGGGIRSASFCLGAVQALARKGLFDKFKYLSTVSGGGYTGSMLAAWAYRTWNGVSDVVAGLHNPAAPQIPNPIAWLRQYCSYLAPRRGVLSVDTWTILITYIRNLLLNSLILVPFLMVIVACPAFVASVADAFAAEAPALTKRFFVQFLLAVGMVSLFVVSFRLRFFSGKGTSTEEYSNKLWSRIISASACVFATAMTGGLLVEALGPTVDRTSYVAGVISWFGLEHIIPRAAYWAVAIGFVGLLIGVIFTVIFKVPSGNVTFDDRATIVIGNVAAGLVIGAGISAWEHLFAFNELPNYTNVSYAFVLGPPALLFVLACGEAVFLGTTSKLNDDYHREWWARLFGWLARWCVIWVALGAIAFAGPKLAEELAKEGIDAIRYPAGILAVGAALARFAFTQGVAGKMTDEKVQSRLARIGQMLFVVAAYVFVVLLLCVLAWLTYRLALGTLVGPWPFAELLRKRALPYSLDRIALVMVPLVVVFFTASFFVNVNKFSLHSMYRDRLIRAFLGASRSAYPAPSDLDGFREDRQFKVRNPNLYTDFDRDDNPILWWMSPKRADKSFPFLVINGALNLVRTKNLAWQERKAASFTFTPLHVGSHLTNYSPSRDFCGEVGGVTLGTALAISGAAVSPNAGYHSTPILTFLLTLFNARLGWWLGNPRRLDKRREIAPTHALAPMIHEMAGKTDAESDWVYVSDGGHFDNLGVYEMVRRGCRYIVAVDASADPRFEYDSLGIAIRKIRIDFGVSIDLIGSLKIGEKTHGEAGAHCALFGICYGDRTGGKDGLLLYIKASHYPRGPSSPVDVRQYASGTSTFPHESTSDQFFGESQFESYRALGEWEVDNITDFKDSVASVQQLFTLAYAHASKYQSDRTATSEALGSASTPTGSAALE